MKQLKIPIRYLPNRLVEDTLTDLAASLRL